MFGKRLWLRIGFSNFYISLMAMNIMTSDIVISLNDMVSHLLDSIYFEKSNVELDLSPHVSKDYYEVFMNANTGLLELSSEVAQHGGDRKKICTKIGRNNSEILEILSNASHLSDDKLELLSSRCQQGKMEKPSWGSRDGSRYAAYSLGRADASVSIENVNEGIYRVKNTVIFS